MQDSNDLRTETLITCTAIGYSGAIMRVGARERPAARVCVCVCVCVCGMSWKTRTWKKLVGCIDNYGDSIDGMLFAGKDAGCILPDLSLSHFSGPNPTK